MILEHFSVGALRCTCTLIGDPKSGHAVLIDAGAEAERILTRVATYGLTVRHLLHTHAHIDHVGATTEIRSRCCARSALHPGDLPLAETLEYQAEFLRLPRIQKPVFDDALADGDEIRIGDATITVLHTPGHTPGSTSFALSHNGTHIIMTGDTLFAGGIGRWDIGGTSMEDIVASIRGKLLPYPDHAVVVPGHGPHSTIGHERMTNPYIRAAR